MADRSQHNPPLKLHRNMPVHGQAVRNLVEQQGQATQANEQQVIRDQLLRMILRNEESRKLSRHAR